MDNVKIFNFESSNVRTVLIDNEPYFVGKDVAGILGYSNPSVAVSKNVSDGFKGVTEMETPGGKQRMTVISEAGVYKLIFKSHAKNAEKFSDWVAEDVLPSIRKHGMYATPDTVDKMIDDPDFGIKLLKQLKEERQQKEALAKKVEEDKPKIAYYQRYLDADSLVNYSSLK